ncbi:MAG TPA: hypothetical protein VEA81_03080 [Burkholderiaceae bacterium]|nr:hypothetical protein [Burkholderiaceae bacterium]
MAIRLRALNLLVPIHAIERRYPGGLEACIDDHEALIGERVWFDGRLWRDGADDPEAMRELVEGWACVGLKPLVCVDGVWRWAELCVVDAMTGAPTLPCPWIEVDTERSTAWLAGEAPGAAVGPDDIPRPGRTIAVRPAARPLVLETPLAVVL